MSNKINLGGKDYEWNFKFKAQRKLEEITNKNSLEILEIIQDIKDKGLPFDFVLKIAYCGLYGANKSITIDQVEDILDNGSGKDISLIIGRYNADMGDYLNAKIDPNEMSQAQ